MKILFDPQIFWWQYHGGISRYFAELFLFLSKEEDVEITMPLASHDNAYLKEMGLFMVSPVHSWIYSFRFRGIGKIRELLIQNKSKAIKEIKKGDFDLFVPTFFDPYFLPYLKGKPFVLTIHDMTHEVIPEFFEPKDKVNQNKVKLLRECSKVIAISENTKKDIIRFFPEHRNNIEVVYHGNSLHLTKAKAIEGLPHKYILFVGMRWKYKNFDFLLSNIASLLIEYNDLHLVCAGGGAFTVEEISKMRQLNVYEKVNYLNFDDEGLAYLYRNCLCFVFPSLYEGFGIPILEAMSCGSVCLLPSLSSFPEVAKDAAIYYHNQEDLQTKIQQIYLGEINVDDYREKGRKRSAQFSWEQTGSNTKKIYSSVLAK